MVNMYRFPFSDILMFGNDGGYWIPLLTNRQSVMPPMTFTMEKVSDPAFADNLRAMESLNGQIATQEGVKLLGKEGITHVYVGEGNGLIDPDQLLTSPNYRLVYEDDPVYIFEYGKTH